MGRRRREELHWRGRDGVRQGRREERREREASLGMKKRGGV
jgi:hypothetical protein